MRRNDREVTEFSEITEIIQKCDVCRLALHDTDYPYILPLNFGMEIINGQIFLYFHGADEGKKFALIAKDNRVSFEMDCSHRLVAQAERGYCTMEYESVIGQGTIEILPEEEKIRGLEVMMRQYHPEGFDWSKAAVPRTAVLKLTVTHCTGKRRMVRK